jgi:hypothetical protein
MRALNELMKFEKFPSKHAEHTHQELMSALTVRAHRLAETIPELFKRLQIRALEKRISMYIPSFEVFLISYKTNSLSYCIGIHNLSL